MHNPTPSSRPLCAICNHRYSIYTCPRCSVRTCSLPCSTTHKYHNSCNGERDKTKWVAMNEYGWGTMMSDYVFLEDVGRKVGEWGRDIGRSGLQITPRGRGEGKGRNGRITGQTKRDVLKMQLELRDIEIELLPMGMERRKHNQSSWDVVHRTALLTIEFIFHPPPNTLHPPSRLPDRPFTLLTHRNNIESPLLSLLQAHIVDRRKSKKHSSTIIPEWVHDLVTPPAEDRESFTPPLCLMSAKLDPLASFNVISPRHEKGFYKFDPTQNLSSLLYNRQFVEFPTIEIWDTGAFGGMIVDTQGLVRQETGHDEERRPKRQRLDRKAGKKAIHGLLGGYGSDDEEASGNMADRKNVLAMLDVYAGSDDDEDDGLGDEDAEGDTDDECNVEMDPAALLEIMRRVQGGEVGEGDQVDWGDSEDDER